MADIPTLSDTVAKLREIYGSRSPVQVRAHDIETANAAGLLEVPAYTYRGEADANWDSTESSMERLRKNDSLSEEDKRQIVELTAALDAHLQKFFKLSKPLSAGLLQHYSLPTELVDVSPVLDVAAFFAAYENTSGTGSITLFPTDRLNGCAMVMDLTVLNFAQRPVSQKGYGVFHGEFRDLRVEGFWEAVKPERYTFRITPVDVERFVKGQPDLLIPYTDDFDPARAVITHLIDLYSKKVEVLTPAAARWLAIRIPPTPLTIVGGEFNKAEAVLDINRRKDAPEPYCREHQIDQNCRRWSGSA